MTKKTDTTTKSTLLVKSATPTPPVAVTVPTAPAAKATPATKPVAPVKRAAKPTAKSKPASKSIKTKAPAAKAAAAKTKKATKVAAPKKPAYSRDDVALRAYFISEKRRAHGHHGDEHQDWVEAERQLAAEGVKPKRLAKA